MKSRGLYNTGRSVLRVLAGGVSPLIHVWESSQMRKQGHVSPGHHLVFIVGAPRTGSTYLYQRLTNSGDVLYVDNLGELFYRNLFFGMAVSRCIFGDLRHNCFRSDFGSTFPYGWHAPSESGPFWYQWIEKGTDYADGSSLTDQQKTQIRNIVSAISHKYRKPFVFKNMNAALRMRLLHDIFPEAKFIILHRDFEKTKESILKAREAVCGNRNVWWSLKPANYESQLSKDPVEQVEYQIRQIYQQIAKDRKLFPEDSCMDVQFEEFLQDEEVHMKKLASFVLGRGSI